MKISYSAVVLEEQSKVKLIEKIQDQIPEGWEIIGHHMTINLGEIDKEYEKFLGLKVKLNVVKIGISDMALAIQVQGFPTKNKIPHITIAVNRKEGGKPFMSNKISDWKPYSLGFDLSGIVTEVGYN